MTANRMRLGIVAVIIAALTMIVAGTSTAFAAGVAPVKQVIESHIGSNVNKTKEEEHAAQPERNICTVASKDVCQSGTLSAETGGFEFAKSIAGGPSPDGDVYVADGGNNRVQEFTSTGEFVLMFGKHVNATTGANVCTQTEILTKSVKCQKGEAGEEAGALRKPRGVAVDPANGNVYVAEPAPENTRVEEYTATGQFVLMIGKEVNQTTKANLCTEEEIQDESVKCQAGVFTGLGGTTVEHGALVEPRAVAVGPGHTLYVGELHSVQEFDQEGKWVAEIREPLEQISSGEDGVVSMLAIDQTGDVYAVYEAVDNIILEFDPASKVINEFTAPEGAFVVSIAIDPVGRLAVIQSGPTLRGILYEVETVAKTLHLVTEFVPPGVGAITFNGNGDMYGVVPGEVVVYEQIPVGELNTQPATCAPGAEVETNTTLDCELNGTVDPWGVAETQVWFEWGRTPVLGESTKPPIPVPPVLAEGEEEPPVNVKAPITGVRPNETFYYRVAGEDAHVKNPELLTSATSSFVTPSVPPRVVGQPTALFAKPSSVDLFGEINPENAGTTYEFQYVDATICQTLEGCAQAGHTKAFASSNYGKIGVMLEAVGLQPATQYRYRLYGINQSSQPAVDQAGGPSLPEGLFTTASAPTPTATTGPAGSIGQTTATIAGSVDPSSQEATYSFELGIYSGAGTQYGTVSSGPAGNGGTIEKALTLTGLQPATTYAYRINVKSGYIDNPTHTLEGAVETFTTLPLSTALQAPPVQQILATPATKFPKPPTPSVKCKKGFKVSKNKCVRAKKAKAKRRKNGKKSSRKTG